MATSPDRRLTRARLEHLFWRGLTALVFTATIAMLFVKPAGAAEPGWTGTWRVALTLPGGPLPFGLEVKQGKSGVTATLLNPPERLRAERASLAGDTLTLSFPSYDSRLVLTRSADDRLTGQAFLARSSGPVTLTATGERGAWRFTPKPAAPAADLTGRWLLDYGSPSQRGLADLRQSGNRITGSVQLPSGDFRYLAGQVSGHQLALSTFDGNAATLWKATLTSNSLTGAQFTATGSKTGTPWTARRAPKDSMDAVVVEKPATDRLAFRFPDSKGRMVSLSDTRFRGKVVVITLGGA